MAHPYPVFPLNQRTTNEKYGEFYEIAKTSLAASPRRLREAHGGWEGRLADTANCEYGAANSGDNSKPYHFHVKSDYIDRHPVSNEKVTLPFDLSYRHPVKKDHMISLTDDMCQSDREAWDPAKCPGPAMPRYFPPPLPPLPPNKKQLGHKYPKEMRSKMPAQRRQACPVQTVPPPPASVPVPIRQVSPEEVPVLRYGNHEVRLPDVNAVELHMRDNSKMIFDIEELKKQSLL